MHFFDGDRPSSPRCPGWFSAGAGFDVNIRHFAPTSADDCTVTAHARVTKMSPSSSSMCARTTASTLSAETYKSAPENPAR